MSETQKSDQEHRVVLVVTGNSDHISSRVHLLMSSPILEFLCCVDTSHVPSDEMRSLCENVALSGIVPPPLFRICNRDTLVPNFLYSLKHDTKNRNKAWKDSLRRANQQGRLRSKGR
jgi:hypothetical protein